MLKFGFYSNIKSLSFMVLCVFLTYKLNFHCFGGWPVEFVKMLPCDWVSLLCIYTEHTSLAQFDLKSGVQQIWVLMPHANSAASLEQANHIGNAFLMFSMFHEKILVYKENNTYTCAGI